MSASQMNAWNAELLKDIDTIVFDCDGVLWLDGVPIEGTVEMLGKLRELGKRVLFVTNNSALSRKGYLKKMGKIGVTDVEHDDIFSSSYAAAYTLVNHTHFDKTQEKCFVVGREGVWEEMNEHGVETITADDVVGHDHFTRKELSTLELDTAVTAVAVGGDDRFTYSKCAMALRYLSQHKPAGYGNKSSEEGEQKPRKETVYISTNQDCTFPTEHCALPGSGSVVAMISNAAQRHPVNCGKPESVMLDIAVERFGLDRNRTLMVGDRLDTDIAFGRRGGLRTLLVLTGVSSMDHVHHEDNKVFPEYFVQSAAHILGL